MPMPTPSGSRTPYRLRFGLYGAILGALFPLGGTLLDMALRDADFSLAGILQAQGAQPLLWIIDLSPFVLGLLGALLGGAWQKLDEAHRQAHQRRAEIDRFFMRSPEGLSVIGWDDGVFRRVNPGFTRLFGYTLSDLERLTPFDLMHPDDAAVQRRGAAKLRRGESLQGLESRFRNKSGDYRWVEWSAIPVTVSGVVYAVARDVTEARAVRAQLEAARGAAEAASRAKTHFLENMSHEIRTPLNGILGMTGLALDTDLTPDQRMFIEAVDQSARSLLGIVDDVLDFSDMQVGKVELVSTTFDVEASLGESLRGLAARAAVKGIDMVYEQAADVPARLVGDPGRLRQVLVNLVGNAIKFTEEGEIVIKVGVAEREDATVTLAVSVRDTGVGMDEEAKEGIFEAFQQADTSATRRYRGTGLGLAICSQLVQMMNGRLAVESTPGVGSVFSFTVRLEVAGPSEAEAEVAATALGGSNVLVVDDNATARRALAGYVRRWGGQPVAVDSAKAALAEARRAHAAGHTFDIVLADAQMHPIGGTELAHRLSEDDEFGKPDTVLIAPADGAAQNAGNGELGQTANVPRPVLPTDLLDALTRRVRPRAEEAPTVRSVAPKAGRPWWGLRVLLVEDNKVNQMLAVALLRKRQHDVTVADGGRQAIDLVRRFDFDVVLMDVEMPEMDGLEATRLIREMEAYGTRRLPIIGITSHTVDEGRQRCLDAGMDDYVRKPIDPVKLEATITRWTGELPDFEPQRALELADGDRSALTSVAEHFLEQTPQQVEAIRRALHAGDRTTLERSAQTIEGAAVSLAMPRLRDLSHRIAILGQRGELDEAAALVAQLDDAVGIGTAAVRRAIGVA